MVRHAATRVELVGSLVLQGGGGRDSRGFRGRGVSFAPCCSKSRSDDVSAVFASHAKNKIAGRIMPL